jgi:hypothetical protein
VTTKGKRGGGGGSRVVVPVAAQAMPLRYTESRTRQRARARKSIRRMVPWRVLVTRRQQLAPLRPAYLGLLRELARIVAAPDDVLAVAFPVPQERPRA